MYAVSTFHETKEGREPPPQPPFLAAYLPKIERPPTAIKPATAAAIMRKPKGSFREVRKGSQAPTPIFANPDTPPQRPTRPTGNLRAPVRLTDGVSRFSFKFVFFSNFGSRGKSFGRSVVCGSMEWRSCCC